MADKIVQLKDKAGNHIFPIAKGLAELSVGTSNIKNQAVTTDKLATNSVTSGKIADGAVATADIANGAVTSAKLTFPIKGGGAGSYIQARDKTTVYNNNFNSSSFTPVASSKTVNGVWSMGTIGWSDELYFCYTTDANYSSGTNAAQSITISPDCNNNLIPNMAKVVTYTTKDPGKNSNLAANRFVAVYEN